MTTAAERLVELSGLPSTSALAHFAAITQGGGGATHPASFGAYIVMREEVLHICTAPRREAPASTRASDVPASRSAPKDRKRAYVFSAPARYEVFTSPERVFVTVKTQSVVVSRPAVPAAHVVKGRKQ